MQALFRFKESPMTVFLRRVLTIDALTCFATGILLAALPTPLASLFGLAPELLFYAGLALFPCAALMLWVALSSRLIRSLANVIIVGNLAWVAGSALVLAMTSPTTLGYAFVIAQAVVVIALADFEWMALRKAA
jgi:hypothetical protein